MNTSIRNTLAAIGMAIIATQASAEVTFYENEGFQGRSFTTHRQASNFERHNFFNNRAQSVVVTSDQWEVCDDTNFKGRCIVLRQGQYPSLEAMGLNNSIASVRSVSRDARIGNQYAPPPVVPYDYRQRQNERLYRANVISVRAVVGPPDQRCWIEREQVTQDRSNANVPGAIFGGVIGGILGHQIGGGSGQDLATAGGVVAGAIVGSSLGRGEQGQQVVSRNVQRCASVPSQSQPDYWDVIYTFRGRQYSVQMTSPPGATVTVNEQGEPRV